jgi:acetolactate synthase-1/2/3 large subunit
VLREAFRQMLGNRHQPVSFEMAPDMMGKTAEIEILPPQTSYAEPPLDAAKLAAAAKLLGGAKAPAIFVGSGVFGCEAELQAIAELLEAPVIIGKTGRGALSDRHRLAAGMLEGQALWPEIDAALVVGTRFVATALSWGREKDVKVVRIDIDPAQAVLPRPADVVLPTGAACCARSCPTRRSWSPT